MTISRRRFLRSAAAISAGFAGLRLADPAAGQGRLARRVGFGPLLDDPKGLIALPEGFGYTVISRHGERMSDGFLVPGLHDGMAAFPGPEGRTVLVRNHEVTPRSDPVMGAFGADLSLLNRVDASRLYDAGTGQGPALGGTTTLLFDTRSQTLVSHHLSLAGTVTNCAGGPTPWGTWITCEESEATAGGRLAKDHGYAFEVPASLDGLPAPAVPLRAMGRFKGEAVAVQPSTGIVYLTEDLVDGLLYRFIPETPGELTRGGKLQALAVRDRPSFDTRNFGASTIEVGSVLSVEWLDLEDVEATEGDLRYRGFDSGAARFARGEGMWYGGDGVYFACTMGGHAEKGQIWRYRPSPHEGRAEEHADPPTLELFIEPNDGSLVENADNLTVAPWGDLIVCEDGDGDDYLVGVTPDGDLYKLARNLSGNGELAGACFSPDGSTLFMNAQYNGLTLAITGPWERRR